MFDLQIRVQHEDFKGEAFNLQKFTRLLRGVMTESILAASSRDNARVEDVSVDVSYVEKHNEVKYPIQVIIHTWAPWWYALPNEKRLKIFIDHAVSKMEALGNGKMSVIVVPVEHATS